jgi:opacity protein-like surface antigen
LGFGNQCVKNISEEPVMKTFLLVAAAAAALTPAMISAASADSVNVRVGSGYPHYRAQATEHVVVSHHCRTVTVRSHRANGSVVIRRTRRCD